MGGRITIVGLGPAGLERLSVEARRALEEGAVLVRTLDHPAAAELAASRPIESGDRFYEQADELEEAYRAIADRVIELAEPGDVAFAVPGSPSMGERTVVLVKELADAHGIPVRVVPGESFLDLLAARAGFDPLERGLQVLDGRRLPDPLLLHLPTVIAQVDRPVLLGEVKEALGKVLPDDFPVTVASELGSMEERVEVVPLGELDRHPTGPRTSLYLDPPSVGWPGLVETVRLLRRECPWDARQTHHSLAQHLIEEAHEVVEALGGLPPEAPGGEPDPLRYAELEAELGDLLAQVVIHATLAREGRAFDVEEVAEGIRRKLVRRHPHVYEDVEVEGAAQVIRNWERLKQEEEQRDSLMDGVSPGLPAMVQAAKLQRRAASVGFDWPAPEPVVDKLAEEVEELRAGLGDPAQAEPELGDVLFAVVSLARHLHIDAEMALRRAAARFAERFRAMEGQGELEGLTLEELDARWEAAKPPAP